MEDLSLRLMNFLMNALWQLPTMVLVASACDTLMGNVPARYRHRIWVAALVLSVAVPIWSVTAPLDVDALSLTSRGPSEARLIETQTLTDLEAVSPRTLPFVSGPVAFSPVVTEVAFACYAAFLLYRAARFWRGWRHVIGIRRRAFERDLGVLCASLVTQCLKAFRLDHVPVLWSRDVGGPLTLSAFSPVVVLPDRLFGIASPDLLLSMVGHEMAHVRRRDFVCNIGYEVLYALVAFHPVAPIIRRRIETTREQSCDEMVTERLLPPAVYAKSLVTMAETLTGPARVFYALGVLDGGRLELRVARLLDKRRRLGPQVSALALTAATALLVVIAAVTSTFSLSASQSFPVSAAAAAATQGHLIGTWRGTWTEVLVPNYKADMDSSPIWLQFAVENGHVVGTVSHDAIDLTEQKGSDVKLMHVLPKHRVSPIFDVDIIGNVVSFKERDRDDAIVEHRLEILQDRSAVLHTKHQPTNGENQPFRPWLTLTRQ